MREIKKNLLAITGILLVAWRCFGGSITPEAAEFIRQFPGLPKKSLLLENDCKYVRGCVTSKGIWLGRFPSDITCGEILSVATVLTENSSPAGAVYAFGEAVQKAPEMLQRHQSMRRLANALCANNQYTRAYDIYTQILTTFSADAKPRQLLLTINEAWTCAGRVKRQDELGETLAAKATEGKMLPSFLSAVGFATLRKDYGLAKRLTEDLVKEYPFAGTSDFLLALCQKLPEDKNSPQDRSDFKDAVLNVILPLSGARRGECVALLIKDLKKRDQFDKALKLVEQYGTNPRVYAACWRDIALVLKNTQGEEKALAFCERIGAAKEAMVKLNLTPK